MIMAVLGLPDIEQRDFSGLRQIYYGASPISESVLRRAIEVFGARFVQMYGMTETSGTIVTLNPEDHDPKGNPRMRSVGTPGRLFSWSR